MLILKLMLSFFSISNRLFSCPTISVNFYFCVCFVQSSCVKVRQLPNKNKINLEGCHEGKLYLSCLKCAEHQSQNKISILDIHESNT